MIVIIVSGISRVVVQHNSRHGDAEYMLLERDSSAGARQDECSGR